mmetsp:Transcript_20810/g.48870  ORF Transcript_20810/g.48870 Transcript_20810/m.48870 type:complete len:291 (+) Transcript_20810:73-945(+)
MATRIDWKAETAESPAKRARRGMEKQVLEGERPPQRQERALSLGDLPDAIHRRYSSFLSIGGRASFAFAMSGTSQSFREHRAPEHVIDTMRSIMLGGPSSEDEFMECEDSSERERTFDDFNSLSDGHLDAFLRAIDARNTVESITISEACTALEIRGKGLEPFRGSATLNQIDLRGAEKLSKRKVLSMLQGIVAAPNNSLRHVQFPTNWLRKRDDTLDEFMNLFNQNQGSKRLPCGTKTCSNACLSRFCTQRSRGNIDFGTIKNTCFSCLSVYCSNVCVGEESSGERLRQ